MPGCGVTTHIKATFDVICVGTTKLADDDERVSRISCQVGNSRRVTRGYLRQTTTLQSSTEQS